MTISNDNLQSICRRVLFSVLLCFATSANLFATGPSHATIKIVPICCNGKGAILCKTYCTVNLSGAHAFQREEFGWLVLSSDGIWEEVPHIILDPDEKNENDCDARSEVCHREFEAELDWKSPPESLKPLIKKHNFKNCDVRQTDGKKSVMSSRTVCKNGKCEDLSFDQKTIKGYKSSNGECVRIKSYFYRHGTAFFHNAGNFENEKNFGSEIHIPNIITGEDAGMDYWTIDGVAFVKKEDKEKK